MVCRPKEPSYPREPALPELMTCANQYDWLERPDLAGVHGMASAGGRQDGTKYVQEPGRGWWVQMVQVQTVPDYK